MCIDENWFVVYHLAVWDIVLFFMDENCFIVYGELLYYSSMLITLLFIDKISLYLSIQVTVLFIDEISLFLSTQVTLLFIGELSLLSIDDIEKNRYIYNDEGMVLNDKSEVLYLQKNTDVK